MAFQKIQYKMNARENDMGIMRKKREKESEKKECTIKGSFNNRKDDTKKRVCSYPPFFVLTFTCLFVIVFVF